MTSYSTAFSPPVGAGTALFKGDSPMWWAVPGSYVWISNSPAVGQTTYFKVVSLSSDQLTATIANV